MLGMFRKRSRETAYRERRITTAHDERLARDERLRRLRRAEMTLERLRELIQDADALLNAQKHGSDTKGGPE